MTSLSTKKWILLLVEMLRFHLPCNIIEIHEWASDDKFSILQSIQAVSINRSGSLKQVDVGPMCRFQLDWNKSSRRYIS